MSAGPQGLAGTVFPTPPPSASLPAYAVYQGQRKKGIVRDTEEYRANCLFDTLLFPATNVSAAQATTSVLAKYVLPTRVKILKIAVDIDAIQAVDGGHSFNIVVGKASTYETVAAAATQTVTWTGTPNHDGTVTVTISGHAVVYTEVSGDTTPTTLMGHVAAAINADTTANKLVSAAAPSGVMTLTALASGLGGNAITVTAATTDSLGAGAIVAGGATLSGGAAATGITTPPPDNEGTSGSGFTTNPATNGQALFAADVPFLAGSAYPSSSDGPFPYVGFTTGSGGRAVFIPSSYDAVYPCGVTLTLRANTPASVGSITGLLVTATMEIQTLRATYPAEYPLPGAGVPVPGIDF